MSSLRILKLLLCVLDFLPIQPEIYPDIVVNDDLRPLNYPRNYMMRRLRLIQSRSSRHG
jgi:hypothetical protein